MARIYHSTILLGGLFQSVCRATGREGGVVYLWMNEALRPGDQLQRSSGKNTCTYKSPPWKIPRMQPSENTRNYLKRYPLISSRMA